MDHTIKSPTDVFLSVVTMTLGVYFLGLIAPHLMAVLQARVSVATIFDVIDWVGLGKLSNTYLGTKEKHISWPSPDHRERPHCLSERSFLLPIEGKQKDP